MIVLIRPAVSDDAAAASQLLLISAPDLLGEVFGEGSQEHALAFLRASMRQPDGQFGYLNHSVATFEGAIAGLYCSWHDQLPKGFDQATIRSIQQFYGTQVGLNVLMRSRQHIQFFTPPTSSQLCIGHLAVSQQWRRKGVASAMLSDAAQSAKVLGKQEVILDVASHNQAAIALYAANGFARQRTGNHGYIRMSRTI